MRDLNADLRNEDLDIGHETYVVEQAALASLAELDAVVESEGEFYGCDSDDGAESAELLALEQEQMQEPYENDLEEFGRNESFQDTMAELDADSFLAQYDE
jgi:hypothetical protein